MNFIGNNSLLIQNKNRLTLDWRLIGPNYWDAYQASIQATTATSIVNDTITIAGGSYPSGNAFRSSVLMADGRVFLIPYNGTSARIYDPVTNTTSTPSPTFPGNAAFFGGVLMKDGRLFLVPFNSTSARVYDPSTDSLSTPAGSYTVNQQIGGTLLPDGRVLIPSSNGNVNGTIYDPYSDTTSLIIKGFTSQGTVLLPNGLIFGQTSATSLGTYNYNTNTISIIYSAGINIYIRGYVLLPDGRVYCVPSNSTNPNAFIYNPSSNSVSTAAGTITASANSGVLLPNGKVLIIPAGGSTSKGSIYDPVSNTLTQTSPTFSVSLGTSVVMLDGRVFLTPYNSSSALIYGGGGGFNRNVSLSSYYNKL